MKYAGALASLALFLVHADASAQDSALASFCLQSTAAAPVRFSRLHQVPTVAPRDDVSHKVVTPGGMVLDTPKLVAATDVLSVIQCDRDTMSFHLLTFSRERQRCELTGIARKEPGGAYLFRDDGVVVRFTFVAADRLNVEPVGSSYRQRCEPLGRIERATYTSSPQ
jgi:hypothetical protein